MCFNEIAEQVAPAIDRIFPPSSGVRIIGEPGRYFVAASSTLCCSVTSCRNNQIDASFNPEAEDDKELADNLNDMSRKKERELVNSFSLSQGDAGTIMNCIQDELEEYSKLYANQQLASQEVAMYNDSIDLYKEGYDTAIDMMGPPDENQREGLKPTVEGMNYSLVTGPNEDGTDPSAFVALAGAGEAVFNGIVMQAIADSAPLQDDYTYYVNDGVYGAFNNIMFDHAICRPRVLNLKHAASVFGEMNDEGFQTLESVSENSSSDEGSTVRELYTSTVFGPTCDSIDVISRSVLLPKLKIGDWLYFENMGAYTSAAASTFNGFNPSKKFYVCSVQPEFFESMIAGPNAAADMAEEKSEKE